MPVKKRFSFLFIFVFFIFSVCFCVFFLLGTKYGSALAVSGLVKYNIPCDFSYGKAEGSLLRQFTLYDAELMAFRMPTRDCCLRVGKTDIYFNAVSSKALSFEIHNGRFFLPVSGPIVFDGIYQDGGLDFRLFFQSLDISDIVSILPEDKGLKKISGILSGGDAVIKGAVSKPRVYGKSFIRFITEDGVLFEGLLNFDLYVRRFGKAKGVFGKAVLTHARVVFPDHQAEFKALKFIFSGDLMNPSLEYKP